MLDPDQLETESFTWEGIWHRTARLTVILITSVGRRTSRANGSWLACWPLNGNVAYTIGGFTPNQPKDALSQHPHVPTKAVPPPPAAAAAPTELEKTQLENIQLRMMLLQDEENSLPQRKQQLQVQYGALIQQIQAEHPGFVWNPQTGGLVPAPKPEVKKP